MSHMKPRIFVLLLLPIRCAALQTLRCESGSWAEELNVEFLQIQARLNKQPSAENPLVWVHPPKTGSSLVNTIIKVPGLCSLPPGFDVTEERYGTRFLEGFIPVCVESCPAFNSHSMGHHGLADLGASGSPTLIGMFRNPEKRIASAYQDMEKVPLERRKTMFATGQCESYGGWPNSSMPTLSAYASLTSGCQLKMLTRDYAECPCSYASPDPTTAELVAAKSRLHEDFLFFGITDEWNLSMCLFDAMYKTGCRPAQFINTRPHTEEIDSSRIVDPWDDEFYKEVQRIFYERIERFNVSPETCQACWTEAGINRPGQLR